MPRTKRANIRPTDHPHIVKIRGVCGGSAVIKGTRTPAWSIVQYNRRVGYSPAEIVAHLPHLTLAQVHDALAYYYDHKKEIDEEVKANSDDKSWKLHVDRRISRKVKKLTAGAR